MRRRRRGGRLPLPGGGGEPAGGAPEVAPGPGRGRTRGSGGPLTPGRIAAVDYGRRRIGVAASDPTGTIVTPRAAVDNEDPPVEPPDELLRRADYVIENTGTLDDLRDRVEALYQRLTRENE